MEDTNAAKILAQLDSMAAYIKELKKKQDEIVTLLKNDVEEIKEEMNIHSTALGDHNDRIEALETKVSSLMNRKTEEEKDDWEIIRDKENARRKKESFFIGKDQKSEQGAGGSSFADILKKNLREDASKVLSKNKFKLDYSRNKDFILLK